MAEFRMTMQGGNGKVLTRQIPDKAKGYTKIQSWNGSVKVTAQRIKDRDVFLIEVEGDIDATAEGI